MGLKLYATRTRGLVGQRNADSWMRDASAARRQQIDSPLAIAAAVERHAAAIGRPCELCSRRIAEHRAHRPVRDVEEPDAVAVHLKDDLRTIRRHGRRTQQALRDW